MFVPVDRPHAGMNDAFELRLTVRVVRHWHVAHADGVEVKQLKVSRAV